jgi:hypothetical protein
LGGLPVYEDAQVHASAILGFHHLDRIAFQEIGMVREVVVRGIVTQHNAEVIGFLIVVGQVEIVAVLGMKTPCEEN